ncbi:hypothetical protein Sme01_11860 [Sphaerisporangium melleum]|uniref:Uncharacterized protein n=1 Tax=Sphaerisporangium melleum TaxID=321316 RepID=A0A917RHX6_9ACTN|nr:hypothetical protein [Sphaerisporangium melleum]GGL07253.1 hypothetical protein GCM10007964_56920 [Sphaerisporangium melleum]GII68710.1 hypothetical protein Sme01_11860 [Sphaerisporangium melleum]
MLVELTMHRAAPTRPTANSPIDGIRILALLPDEWRKDLRQANGGIVIRVDTEDDTTSDQIRATVAEVLKDPAISHWELSACQTLTKGSPPGDPS